MDSGSGRESSIASPGRERLPLHSADRNERVPMSAVSEIDRLRSFIAARVGPSASVRIEGFERIGTGRSRENWLFDAVIEEGAKFVREPLIARRDPTGGLLDTNRAVEFAILRALETTRLPTPKARWLDQTGNELGRPCLIMERLPGRCSYYELSGPAPLSERVDLARRLCALLADVHAVDWRGVGLGEHLADPGPRAALTALDEWVAVLRKDQVEPYPELDLALAWLREGAPQSPRTVLVHADFKVGNVLLDDGRIVALLDWELAHLGDPHEDLGWVTQPLRTREHLIPDSWEREDLLFHYEQVSGHAVDRDAVSWWNAFAAFKTAVMQASGLRSFVDGRSDELYQPSAAVLRTLLELLAA
jgi:aminoglycoside phosphotransferase (APT) family kinase protein